MSRICVTVTADTTAELRRKRDEVSHADLVELRLDTVKDPNVAAALAGRKHPVIVTCRPSWEGGQFTGSEEERKQILRDAIARGAEYVDIEWKANFTDLLSPTTGRRIVISSHSFDGVPGDLFGRAQAMRAWLQTATGCNCTTLDVCALFDDHALADEAPAPPALNITQVPGG